jgi:hypothetical protein
LLSAVCCPVLETTPTAVSSGKREPVVKLDRADFAEF